MNTLSKTVLTVCLFGIAMAALESAVVIYLRALYYPGQFTVALKLIDDHILRVEILREIATLIMLCSVGYLAGRNSRERLAYFLLSFAVWDIFYYIWLKVLIDWPASVLEWDILFLIPFTWLGPVLAPLICSVTMIALASVLLLRHEGLPPYSWSLLAAGSAFILYTFMEDYAGIFITHGFLYDYARIMQNEDFIKIASAYIPDSYNWLVFWIGELLVLAGITGSWRGN